jgi:hypothetical protein
VPCAAGVRQNRSAGAVRRDVKRLGVPVRRDIARRLIDSFAIERVGGLWYGRHGLFDGSLGVAKYMLMPHRYVLVAALLLVGF